MKKTLRILLFAGILIVAYSCGSQKKVLLDSNKELPKELFQRWKLDYGTNDGEKINGLPQSPSNDYEFKPNGEYLLYNRDGTFMTGTWSFNKEEEIIYTKRDDGELNGKITNIKAETIILIPAGKAVEGTPFEKFQFYYIPKNE